MSKSISVNSLPSPDPSEFATHRIKVRGVDLAYIREGVGGFPIVLVHGWPSSKRTWWRNIRELANAGFEVIAPDHRGYGESEVPADPKNYADMPSVGRDIYELVTRLGHKRCVLVGYDWGAGVVQDCSRRHPGFVTRQVIMNGIVPMLTEQYNAAGIPGTQSDDIFALSDHFHDLGPGADEIMKELNTPDKRRQYISGYLFGRAWKKGGPIIKLASDGSFNEASAYFHADAFSDAAHFRAALGFYEAILIPELLSEPLLLGEPDNTETLVLLGPEDGILRLHFTRRMEVAYGAQCIGPFIIEGAGHFPHWERPDVVNKAIVMFCRDLLAKRSP